MKAVMKRGFSFKRAAYRACAIGGAASLGLASSQTFARTIGDVANNISGSFNAIGLAAQAFFALTGIILIGMSIFLFIKHNKTEGQQTKLSTAFLYLIGGGVLFYIASVIETTGDTVWGNGGGNRSRVQIGY